MWFIRVLGPLDCVTTRQINQRSRESSEIEAALAMPKFREILQTPPKPDEQIVKEMGLDKLDVSRLKELKALLGTLEQLKGRQDE